MTRHKIFIANPIPTHVIDFIYWSYIHLKYVFLSIFLHVNHGSRGKRLEISMIKHFKTLLIIISFIIAGYFVNLPTREGFLPVTFRNISLTQFKTIKENSVILTKT